MFLRTGPSIRALRPARAAEQVRYIAPQLPTVLGSIAALLVAFVSLLNGATPGSCVAKSGAAFLVLAGFGLVLRFALLGGPAGPDSQHGDASGLDIVVPGATVSELLRDTTDPAQHTDPE